MNQLQRFCIILGAMLFLTSRNAWDEDVIIYLPAPEMTSPAMYPFLGFNDDKTKVHKMVAYYPISESLNSNVDFLITSPSIFWLHYI